MCSLYAQMLPLTAPPPPNPTLFALIWSLYSQLMHLGNALLSTFFRVCDSNLPPHISFLLYSTFPFIFFLNPIPCEHALVCYNHISFSCSYIFSLLLSLSPSDYLIMYLFYGNTPVPGLNVSPFLFDYVIMYFLYNKTPASVSVFQAQWPSG